MIQTRKLSLFRRLKFWIRKHPRWSIGILSGIIVILAAGTTITILMSRTPEPELPTATKKTVKKEAPKPVFYSPLTGAEVDTEAQTTQPVTAIMIENSPDARPQSGLKNSGVVFEAIAEGGITRFLALYQEQKPALIGPVRSLRMYYVDWLAPFDASVAHVGGSAAALSEIRNGNYRDIDQFFNASAYWRASDRYAPHNVYTNFEKLDALNAAKNYTSSAPTSFKRKDSKASASPTATTIAVTMSGPLYNSSYTYNAETNTYDRSQGGAPHLDREDGQISPRVVVVMKTPMKLVMEDGYRQQYTTVGSGTAYIFQDGEVQEVTWHKTDRTSQITFTNSSGAEVALARGQTWVTVVPDSTGGASWQ